MGSRIKMILLTSLLSLLVTFPLGSLLPSESSTCYSGWADGTLVGMGCLFFESNANFTWEEANFFCQETYSATLVSIETQDQQEFVIMMIGFLNNHEESHSWWTSGTDTGREGEWYWASTLTAVGNFIWHSDQPTETLTENCLRLSSGMGYDRPCNEVNFPI